MPLLVIAQMRRKMSLLAGAHASDHEVDEGMWGSKQVWSLIMLPLVPECGHGLKSDANEPY